MKILFILLAFLTCPSVTLAKVGDIEQPNFSGKDVKRKRIPAALEVIAEGFRHPTDLQFIPSREDTLIVLEKSGKIMATRLKNNLQMQDRKQVRVVGDLKVKTQSELGLLGLAFHPRFTRNRKIYVNHNPKNSKKTITRISEFVMELDEDGFPRTIGSERIILEVEQPYSNHNAGQLQFGPDGFLYVGLGDGGSANDPHGHGQNPKTLLGSMLRIDITRKDKGKQYAVPRSNPRVSGMAPEIWAWGLRNPWRYSFGPAGKLWVGDVGQNRFEEISTVSKGQNHGWKSREGLSCFHPKRGCRTRGMTHPLVAYDREDGSSVTGGYVSQSGNVRYLRNKYVFGDFGSGRIWAITLPKGKKAKKRIKMLSLGKFSISPSTFGRAPNGQILVADYLSGRIFRIVGADSSR